MRRSTNRLPKNLKGLNYCLALTKHESTKKNTHIFTIESRETHSTQKSVDSVQLKNEKKMGTV